MYARLGQLPAFAPNPYTFAISMAIRVFAGKKQKEAEEKMLRLLQQKLELQRRGELDKAALIDEEMAMLRAQAYAEQRALQIEINQQLAREAKGIAPPPGSISAQVSGQQKTASWLLPLAVGGGLLLAA